MPLEAIEEAWAAVTPAADAPNRSQSRAVPQSDAIKGHPMHSHLPPMHPIDHSLELFRNHLQMGIVPLQHACHTLLRRLLLLMLLRLRLRLSLRLRLRLRLRRRLLPCLQPIKAVAAGRHWWKQPLLSKRLMRDAIIHHQRSNQ
jgi:hypothetical protein